MKIAKAKLIAILVMIAALWTLGVADTLAPIAPLPDYVAPKLAPIVLAQPEPPVVPDSFTLSYQWSFSGHEYLVVQKTIYSEPLGFQGFDLVAAAGYELTSATTPAFGFGLAYRFDLSKEGTIFAQAGAYALFPQKRQPDLTLGLTFGVKF